MRSINFEPVHFFSFNGLRGKFLEIPTLKTEQTCV